jgi:heptosyltransferase-2
MKVLLIRFSSLGDCVLLCPLARHLKSKGGGTGAGAEEVCVVTKTAFVELFAATEGIDRVIGYDPQSGQSGLFRIARELRGHGYRVIDAHNNWRSRILSAALGGAAGRIRKYYRQRVGLILLKTPANIPSVLRRYGALAEAIGMQCADLRPGGIIVPDRLDRLAADRLGAGARPWIGVAPGSRWPMKRWPIEGYLALARRLAASHRLLLMGDAADRAVTSRIAVELGDSCLDLAGQVGVVAGAAYLKRCLALVGNDSGLTHLAEAMGVPVVALFGPTVEAFGYYPALARSRVVERRLSCRPCSRNGSRPCPKGTQECLTKIDVDSVARAVDAVLTNSGPTRFVLPS